MHEREHQHLPAAKPSISFALDIGKCHLKKKCEVKSYPHCSFFGKKIDFLLNHVYINVIYVNKSLEIEKEIKNIDLFATYVYD